MSRRDYYEVLGVSRDVGEKEIKKAYRRMAMKFHPDRNTEDGRAEEKFKEVNEAFEVLSDPQKRAAYDQHGHAGVDPNMGSGGGEYGNFSDVFGDVFGDIFGGAGGGRGRSSVQRGSDMRYALDLDLEEAVRGTTKKIRIPTLVQCNTCKGTGAKKGSSPITCSTCGGHGQIRMQQGFFTVQQTCPECHGSGKVIKDRCPDCHGEGRIREYKTLSVKVPAGVDTGDRIRLSGEGEAGVNGGPSGDLYVQMDVRDHAIFQRDGKHLYCEVPISILDATLGGDMEVPTLEGKVKLKIPVETQTGKMFRMRGKGIPPVRGGGVGDLICKVMVETPVNLTAHQKELLQQLQQSFENESNDHSPQKRSFFDSVGKFFDSMRS